VTPGAGPARYSVIYTDTQTNTDWRDPRTKKPKKQGISEKKNKKKKTKEVGWTQISGWGCDAKKDGIRM
jgi:hypothetical protein